MQASELRIGNWIYDHEKKPKQIAYVGATIGLQLENGATQKYQYNPIYSGDINDLSPIPITEEWLVKFGFVDNGFGGLYLPNTGSEWEVCGMTYGFVVAHESADARLWNIPIQYVHQLQNLYFALTDEELTIK